MIIEEVIIFKPPDDTETWTKRRRLLRHEQNCGGVRLEVRELRIVLTLTDDWNCSGSSHTFALQSGSRLQSRHCRLYLLHIPAGNGFHYLVNPIFY
jgi:hypothetical protein